jgi:hypothetical protein
MSGRGNRYQVTGYIQAMVHAELIYVGEAGGDAMGCQMGNVEKYIGLLCFFHFAQDTASYHIPGSQFRKGCVFGHKALPIDISEYSAFTAHCLRNQEGGYSRHAQGGGVELEEFHIGYFGAGFQSQRNSVPCGHGGIGGEFKKLSCSASCQDEVAAFEFFLCPCFTIQDSDAPGSVIFNNNISCQVVLQYRQASGTCSFTECNLDMFTGSITSGMEDARCAVGSFQCKCYFAIYGIERHA